MPAYAYLALTFCGGVGVATPVYSDTIANKRLVKKPPVRQNPENGVCKSYACLSVYHSSILSTVTVDLFDPRIEDTTNTKTMLHNTADRIV